MAQLEYKAVALPQLVAGRRRRGQASAEVIAEMVSNIINTQAERGWHYSGSDSYRAMERKNWWSRSEEVVYSVLLFEREAPAGGRRAEPEEQPSRVARGGFDPMERRAPTRAAPVYEPEDDDGEFEPAPRGRMDARFDARRRGFEERDGFDDRDAFDDREGFDDDGYDDDDRGGRFSGGGRMRRQR